MKFLITTFNKVLYKKSLYTEPFLLAVIEVKTFTKKYLITKNKTKKNLEIEQYFMALEYFCKLKFPII